VKLFGVQWNGTRVSLCEWFAAHSHPVLDVFAGLSYITWIPFPVAFSALCFFTGHRELAFRFWVSHFFTTSLGFVLYVVCPAAPPWYYFEYGNEVNFTIKGQPGGLARFDELIGFPLYTSIYSQNQNVFGAMPSMHAAFPMALTFYSLKYGCKPLSCLFALSAVGIWFCAVYASHHYVLDVLAGWTCCVCGISITEHWWRISARRYDSFLAAYLRRISAEGTLAGGHNGSSASNGAKHAYTAVPTNDLVDP